MINFDYLNLDLKDLIDTYWINNEEGWIDRCWMNIEEGWIDRC